MMFKHYIHVESIMPSIFVNIFNRQQRKLNVCIIIYFFFLEWQDFWNSFWGTSPDICACHTHLILTNRVKYIAKQDLSQSGLCFMFQMDFQESNIARLLLSAGMPTQVHSRLGSGSSSSPCTPAMQRADFSQVYTVVSHNPCPFIFSNFYLISSNFSLFSLSFQ